MLENYRDMCPACQCLSLQSPAYCTHQDQTNPSLMQSCPWAKTFGEISQWFFSHTDANLLITSEAGLGWRRRSGEAPMFKYSHSIFLISCTPRPAFLRKLLRAWRCQNIQYKCIPEHTHHWSPKCLLSSFQTKLNELFHLPWVHGSVLCTHSCMSDRQLVCAFVCVCLQDKK